MYCNPICAAQSAKCLVLKYVPYFQRLFFRSLLLMKGTFFTLWCNFCEQQNRRHTHCRQCTVVDREPYKTLVKPLSIIPLQRFYGYEFYKVFFLSQHVIWLIMGIDNLQNITLKTISTLQMFAGIYRDSAGVFCNICRENPVVFTDCREIPADIAGFPCRYCRKTP